MSADRPPAGARADAAGEGAPVRRDPAEQRLLHEAARWHVRLGDAGASAADHQAWQHWHAADPAHQQAWARVQAVRAQFARLPRSLLPVLDGGRPAGRRGVLRGLALGLGGAGAAWFALRDQPWQVWQAAHRTATGERRTLQLADGSALTLDTASAVDVDFGATERVLHLRAGRILVATRAEPQARPFSVQTPQGRVRALGTRFSVQLLDGASQVVVQEHAVRVQPHEGAAQELQAGQQLRFTVLAAGQVEPAPPLSDSWKDGSLVAVDMPLGRLVDELARYRTGHLGCAPEIAQLRVSGVFPTADTDLALATLGNQLPVQVVRRTRWWTRVERR